MSGRPSPTLGSASDAIEVDLPIAGMTCASCVNRIERFLSRTPGVESAVVNLATEMATVRYLPDVAGRAQLVGAIEAAGYDLRLRAGADPTADAAGRSVDVALAADDADRARELRTLAIQAGVSIGVAGVIMVAMFWPQSVVPLETLNSLVLVPATFVQVWAGGRFYRAAWRAARHGTTNMDTLVAVGTTAAWAYSVFVTLSPEVVSRPG